MSRNLAPTGKTFSRLEIGSTNDSDTFPIVIYPDSRELLNQILHREWEDSGDEAQNLQLTGVLRALNLERDWLEIKLDEGMLVRVYQTGEVIDDIVGPMVNRKVIVNVALSSRNNRYLYRDIQLEE